MPQYPEITAIIRAQPLHNGHMFLIERGLEMAKKVNIVIGSSDKFLTRNNPLNAEQRKQALSIALRTLLIGDRSRIGNIYFLEDVDDNDIEWSKNLESLVGKKAVILTNNEDEWTDNVLGKRGHKILRTTLANRNDWMGENIRRLIREGSSIWRKFIPEEVLKYYDSIDLVGIVTKSPTNALN